MTEWVNTAGISSCLHVAKVYSQVESGRLFIQTENTDQTAWMPQLTLSLMYSLCLLTRTFLFKHTVDFNGSNTFGAMKICLRQG